MAWKETYTTAKGDRRYRVAWRQNDGKRRSKTFTRSKDADAFKLEIERREQLGSLWEAPPESFGEFYRGWKERYRQRVRPSTDGRTSNDISSPTTNFRSTGSPQARWKTMP